MYDVGLDRPALERALGFHLGHSTGWVIGMSHYHLAHLACLGGLILVLFGRISPGRVRPNPGVGFVPRKDVAIEVYLQ